VRLHYFVITAFAGIKLESGLDRILFFAVSVLFFSFLFSRRSLIKCLVGLVAG
jgi:hypothetical protein